MRSCRSAIRREENVSMSPISSIVAWIALGLIAGVVTMILPYRRGVVGMATNAGLGIAGALLGGALGRLLFYRHTVNSWSFLCASVGALFVLWAFHAWWTRAHTRGHTPAR
jgi:uncharacterized membrane protein YeaQ/YmgE (transglycosylase-associated protein family)